MSKPLQEPRAAEHSRETGALPVERGSRTEEDLGDDAAPARSGGLSEMLRKAMVASLGAVFMTEEGIRTLVRDLKLPKDVMGYLVAQADRSKGELLRVIGQEVRRLFESAAMKAELGKLLSDVVIDIHAEVRLKRDGEEPRVKVHSAAARHGAKRGER